MSKESKHVRALMAASVAVTLAVAPARAAEEINFGIISTEASSKPQEDLGSLPSRYGEGHRRQDQRLLRLRLRRRDRRHALQARSRSPGSATSRPWRRSIAPKARCSPRPSPPRPGRLLLHISSTRTVRSRPGRRAEVRQDPRLRIGDPNSTSGFLVPDHVHLRQEHRSEAVSRPCATPTMRRTRSQWPTSWWTSATSNSEKLERKPRPRRRSPRRSASSGPPR